MSSARWNSLKLNCQTQSSSFMRGRLPVESVKVRPSWMSFSMSTFSLLLLCVVSMHIRFKMAGVYKSEKPSPTSMCWMLCG